MAHAFVAGGLPSDSERDIAVGGVSVVPLELFAGIDYTALGHLHGRATLTESVRYSGSPIAYSFSEADHVKGSWLVDLDADGFERAASSRRRCRARSPGSRARSTTCSPTPDSARTRSRWVQVTLTDAARPDPGDGAAARAFPARPGARFAPARRRAGPGDTAGRSAHDIALDFVAHVRGAPATEAESDLLRSAWSAARDDPDLVAGRDTVVSG